jgi:hypothetical protein
VKKALAAELLLDKVGGQKKIASGVLKFADINEVTAIVRRCLTAMHPN